MTKIPALLAAACLVLGGCATTIHSDVTAFNDWPADLSDKSYVFDAPAPPEDTLEYRSYQQLVSNELSRLGFTPAADPRGARLKVGMHFRTVDQAVHVLQAYDPFWGGPGYWGRGSYYRGPFRPYYDPFFYGPTMVDETIQHIYERQLNVTINAADGKKLFDATVSNASHVRATPHVMPALVQSAFAGFPGRSGQPYRIDIKIDPKMDEQPAPAKVAGDAKS
ncbi:DUF4136 domain-containing protein [Rugamonas sp.]|uniref:DUF4136 domain-containing protein n=1 Tax=Rugamonas sp. TaxID=1926287 RepID=UPI0025D70E68|nr:DUF4136 domain-containing protein [Rugamonas sp.]